MQKQNSEKKKRQHPFVCLLGILWVYASFFAIELYLRFFVRSANDSGLVFSGLWVLILGSAILILPRILGRLVYFAAYIAFAGFAAGQLGCKAILKHMIWISDIVHITEGADYSAVLRGGLEPSFWYLTAALIVIGIIGIIIFPRYRRRFDILLFFCLIVISAFAFRQTILDEFLHIDPNEVHEYYDATVFRQTQNNYGIYTTFYDPERVFEIVGYYQLIEQDIYRHHIYVLTDDYKQSIKEKEKDVSLFLKERDAHKENEMTGIFEDKNLVLVLLESMDDFVINESDTPVISKMMKEGINFTEFYTPIYSSIHTFNTELCVNVGYYMPTGGVSPLAYSGNDFSQSLPSLLRKAGYTARTYHYNSPVFYNRGVMMPAMGFEEYVCYEDYLPDGDSVKSLYDDSFMLKNSRLCDMMFPDGKFFDYIITRNAHTPFVYDDDFARYALTQYPEYYDKYDNETINVIECKARLVDDMFEMLLDRLEEYGHLDDTVIVAFTDHYAYSIADQEMVRELSGVTNTYHAMRTPCFIWSNDIESMECTKTLNTADLLPTLINMWGIDEGFDYLGRDAFDDDYEGYVVFGDGAWLYNDILCGTDGVYTELAAGAADKCDIDGMRKRAELFIKASDALLMTDYYSK